MILPLSAETLAFGGHSDWYLPAIAELDTLYQNRNAIGNFNAATYWSSTEGNQPYYATSENLVNAFQNPSEAKHSSMNVRCVRRN